MFPIASAELRSWKEIAVYLGVTVRTAQKWEHERGLPVRHVPGPRRGAVLILPAEIEAWKRADQSPVAVPPPPKRGWRRWTWPLAAALVVAGVLFAWPHGSSPMAYRIAPNALIITDEVGRELWRKQFDGLADDAYPNTPAVWIGDLGDGRRTVLFLAISNVSGPNPLIAFNSDGSERWRFTPGRAVHTATRSFSSSFRAAHFLVAHLGRAGKTRIAVSSIHDPAYPCQIALLDTNGNLLREYWHSGHLNHLLAADLTHSGWNLLLAGGISNARKTSTLIVLDPDQFAGASKEEQPSFQLQDFPPPVENARVLFPRSCINQTLEPFTTITRLWQDHDIINLEVQHRLSPPDATIYYQLRSDLTIDQSIVSSSFERAHLALHANHVIDHDLSEREIQAFNKLTYVTAERLH